MIRDQNGFIDFRSITDQDIQFFLARGRRARAEVFWQVAERIFRFGRR